MITHVRSTTEPLGRITGTDILSPVIGSRYSSGVSRSREAVSRSREAVSPEAEVSGLRELVGTFGV